MCDNNLKNPAPYSQAKVHTCQEDKVTSHLKAS